MSGKTVNTSTLLLCGVFDAAKGDYVLTKRSIEKALKQDSRGVACVYSCIDIGAEETDEVKTLERLLLCRTGRYG